MCRVLKGKLIDSVIIQSGLYLYREIQSVMYAVSLRELSLVLWGS
jgi:hypothetical protein